MRKTFTKQERLRSKREIDELFQNNQSIFIYPFKILYVNKIDEEHYGANVLFTMSHKKFKHAVQRNTIKRHLRESYRIHKVNLIQLLEQKKIHAHIAWIYVADTILSHQEIEAKMILSLNSLCNIFKQETYINYNVK